MATKKRVVEDSSHDSRVEDWELDNGLSINVYVWKSIKIHVASKTGDVTDQVYNKLVELEQFKNINLLSRECYYIDISIDMVSDFIEMVEKIDASQLKQGKVY